MQMIEVKKSSNVQAIGYDDQAQDLRIRFKNGGEYIYHGVPADVAEGMIQENDKEDGSVGKYFINHIRSKYENDKIEAKPADEDAANVAAVMKVAEQE